MRNLAAHLQTQREAALETITVRANEILETTRRMRTLELKVLEQRGESGDFTEPAATPTARQTDRAPGGEGTAEPPLDPGPGDTSDGQRRKGWWR